MALVVRNPCQHSGSSGKESCQCRRHKRCSFRKIPWRRKWQPTPVFLPRKSYGQRSLVGYSSWSRKELARTERLSTNNRPSPTVWISLQRSCFVLKFSPNHLLIKHIYLTYGHTVWRLSFFFYKVILLDFHFVTFHLVRHLV